MSGVRLPDDAIERILDTWPVARLATLGPGGRPHQVPVVFVRESSRIWSPVDGKPKAGGELARVRNARRDPEVGLLLDRYGADWTRLWWVRLDGIAEVRIPADPQADREVAAVVGALRRKYPQYRDVPVLAEPPTLLAIRIVAVRSWCAGPAALEALPE